MFSDLSEKLYHIKGDKHETHPEGFGVHSKLLFLLHAFASDTTPFLTRQSVGRVAI